MSVDVRTDPRSLRTLDALQHALTETVRTTPLSQVSVAELCRRAGVHRTTFYKHFATVTELARETLADLLARLEVPDGRDDYDAWLTALLDHVGAHRRTYAGLIGPDGDPALVRAVCDRLVVRSEEALRARVGAEVPDADVAVGARVLGFGAYGALEAVLLEADPAGTAAAFLRSLSLPWSDRRAPDRSSV
ncbi:TetR/AcrR family transcriptional regulator [Georgenia subflava]|uniref:TetR family transcriptional regulator n=1 Tax=Georgenia subflava TaxID=1622177 RepID=A0A6N7EPB9_9MICO|nr:TetR/AcrR family transcriptional regulator [Georgenia subflava]MPV38963.1 TetR family transcriptional regulator [Georgenia subflava]